MPTRRENVWGKGEKRTWMRKGKGKMEERVRELESEGRKQLAPYWMLSPFVRPQ